MKSQYYASLFFLFIFLSISIYSLYNYCVYRLDVKKSKLLEYEFVRKDEKNGRGRYYTMQLIYEHRSYSVSITEHEYDEIDDGIYPSLYYSEKKGTIFSEWEMNSSWRVFLLFFTGSILCAYLTIRLRRKL